MEATNFENGVDAGQLQGYIDAIRNTSEMGAVRVRTTHRWDGGYAVASRMERLNQSGQEMMRTHHTLRTDWPEPFGGDSGPTPGVEVLVAALGSCVATTYAVKAALRGVELDELEVTVEGAVDLQGLFELNDVMPRFSEMAVTVHVRSEADDPAIEALGEATTRSSPVFDSMANPVPLELNVKRVG